MLARTTTRSAPSTPAMRPTCTTSVRTPRTRGGRSNVSRLGINQTNRRFEARSPHVPHLGYAGCVGPLGAVCYDQASLNVDHCTIRRADRRAEQLPVQRHLL